MTTAGRRPHSGRPYAFSLRRLSLCFGLIALVLLAAGTALKAGVRAADDHPVAAVALGLLALAAAVLVRRRRVRVTRTAALGPSAPGDVLTPDAIVPAAPVEEPLEVEEPLAEVGFEAMSAEEFEQAVADLCRRDGCRAAEVVGGAGDLGADVLAVTQDGQRLVIQCKRYDAAHKVGSQDLQRFGGTCFAVHDAHIAAVVTTSEFTEPALEYAAQCGILCLDGQALATWASTGSAPWTE
ncbi:restriction endonuclease [Streptomyces hygroscopicus subsp. hygroscopicus]|uniref:restriction endonuclease n=1 Tax=Streptomyces hygroscopicus TaxID=1912 RepID=UPI001C65D257|nr:restriction endonuclease [Streptomyces hygroscopicus]MBW8093716.1 restriction endonuclease [Streptomyces hygroscopicus subsp. hygroscopicus]